MEMQALILSLGNKLHCGGSYRNEKNQNEVLRYLDVTVAACEAFEAALRASDLMLYTENRIGDNRFATYVSTEGEVHLCFYLAIAELRVIYGNRGYLPPKTAPHASADAQEPL